MSSKEPTKPVYEEASQVVDDPKSPNSAIELQNQKYIDVESSEEKADETEEISTLTPTDSKIKEKTDNAPKLPFIKLFAKFLWFGCRAFGGPVAQINLMKQELVDDEGWISKERFNLVYGVYQIVPGPEAYELACYFGMISRGYFGALLGGLGFALPGVLLELLFSYLYVKYGVSNVHVSASFTFAFNLQ